MAPLDDKKVRPIFSARRKLAVHDFRFTRFKASAFGLRFWVLSLFTKAMVTTEELSCVTRLRWNEIVVPCRVERVWDFEDTYRFVVRPRGLSGWWKLRAIRRDFERCEAGWCPEHVSLEGRVSIRLTFD